MTSTVWRTLASYHSSGAGCSWVGQDGDGTTDLSCGIQMILKEKKINCTWTVSQRQFIKCETQNLLQSLQSILCAIAYPLLSSIPKYSSLLLLPFGGVQFISIQVTWNFQRQLTSMKNNVYFIIQLRIYIFYIDMNSNNIRWSVARSRKQLIRFILFFISKRKRNLSIYSLKAFY